MDGFKKFILRGNVVDLAVGVVIGAAFGAVITAFVTGVITPLIGLFGNKSFDQYSVCLKGSCELDAKTGKISGVLLQYGSVLTALLNFLLIAAVVYFAVVKPVQKLMDRSKSSEPAAPTTTKDCPECLSSIPMEAVRCAYCTVEQIDA